MLRRMRFSPLGLVAGLCTLTAMAATMVVAAPGGAATPTKEYSATFEPACVIAPGVFNITAKLRANIRALAPESVNPGESFELTEATSAITSPKELTESFVALGVHEVRGHITNFVLDATNLEPAKFNIAEPAEYPTGLPFFAQVKKEQAVAFNAPALAVGESPHPFKYGPLKATGAAGTVAKSTVDTAVGYEENVEAGYTATGKGIVSEIEGVNEKGEHVLGPIPVACNGPANVVVAEIPIGGTVTTTSTTNSSSTTTTSSTTTSTTTTTSSSTTSTTAPIEAKFEKWVLRGSVTDKKINETITLPSGCTFNGKATIPGALEGNTSCPAFRATLRVSGSIPTTTGLSLTQAEPLKGTITTGKISGDLLLKATAKETINVTSVSEFGLTILTNCKTITPVSFPLEAEAPATALTTGTTFKGEVTVPKYTCSGGFLGSNFSSVLNEKLSGSNNPFTLSIAPK